LPVGPKEKRWNALDMSMIVGRTGEFIELPPFDSGNKMGASSISDIRYSDNVKKYATLVDNAKNSVNESATASSNMDRGYTISFIELKSTFNSGEKCTKRMEPSNVSVIQRGVNVIEETKADASMRLIPGNSNAEHGVNLSGNTPPEFEKIHNLAFSLNPTPPNVATTRVI
jgi:hypothetical protein